MTFDMKSGEWSRSRLKWIGNLCKSIFVLVSDLFMFIFVILFWKLISSKNIHNLAGVCGTQIHKMWSLSLRFWDKVDFQMNNFGHNWMRLQYCTTKKNRWKREKIGVIGFGVALLNFQHIQITIKLQLIWHLPPTRYAQQNAGRKCVRTTFSAGS